ncbi:hypothetical protein VCNEP21106_003474A, partial [Vibrio cholerae O1 str. Nep-21106]
MSRGGCSC